MIVIEITEERFKEFEKREYTYFANGCIFDVNTDNLIAFPFYESGIEEPSKYYLIIE